MATPDKKFIIVVLLLLIGIGICLYFISTSPKDDVTLSDNETFTIIKDLINPAASGLAFKETADMNKSAGSISNGTVMP